LSEVVVDATRKLTHCGTKDNAIGPISTEQAIATDGLAEGVWC